jgi:hypothetical protein
MLSATWLKREVMVLTRLAVTDDSNIGQSLDLIMLLELERDLSNPSRISALYHQVSVELIAPVIVGMR